MKTLKDNEISTSHVGHRLVMVSQYDLYQKHDVNSGYMKGRKKNCLAGDALFAVRLNINDMI